MPFSNSHPFTKVEVANAPNRKGVYQLYYASGEVVYIGSSEGSIRSRLETHKSKTKFMRVKTFRCMRVGEDIWGTTAKHIERRLCKKFYKQHGRLPRLQERSPKHIDLADWLELD